MLVQTSVPWKPQNGHHYGTVEVRMADDFQRVDPQMWGIVEARDLINSTSFEVLRIVGRTEWFERFNWLNGGANPRPWPQALGGGEYAAQTALAGLMVADCPHLSIKRLEVSGVPGPGVHFQRAPFHCQSASFYRVGWPLYGSYDSYPGGSTPRSITVTGGNWWGDAWGSSGSPGARGVSLRHLEEPEKISARGELVLDEAGFLLEDFTHQADGISLKVSGTEFVVRRASVGPSFFNGTVPDNLTTFPDPVRYRHLHESNHCLVEDSLFTSTFLSFQQPDALVRISYPFTTPLTFRRCVFVLGRHAYAVQINWANVVFEDCDFVGSTEAAKLVQLSPANPPLPAATATYTNSKFWAS